MTNCKNKSHSHSQREIPFNNLILDTLYLNKCTGVITEGKVHSAHISASSEETQWKGCYC